MEYAHVLKTWPVFFEAVLEGKKKFEVRSTFDRLFAEGQHILLKEWIPTGEDEGYTGRWIHIQVTYTLDGSQKFGWSNHCIFSFVIVRRGKDEQPDTN